MMAELLADLLAQQRSWSGMLPSPEDFARYPQHVQERMLGWNDATTSDESRRQDKLVDAEIAEAKRGPTRAMCLAAVCILASIYFFHRANGTSDIVAGSALLAAPVLTLAARFISSVRSQSSRSEPPPAINGGRSQEDDATDVVE